MADPQSVTIEDLNREELLSLIRLRAMRITERDLVMARWDVTSQCARAAWEAVLASFDITKPLAEAVDLAKTVQAKIDALAAFRAAQEEREKLERRAERLDRQEQVLYRRLKELPR